MEENNRTIDNFAKLMKAKHIRIPVIQRDYAYGRKSEKIETIREGFIESLFKAVAAPEQKKMDINYIYGINKQGDEFMPIDGQQRLTTIYLFLWFCAVKEERTDLFCKAAKSFSYQVRDTSERFFDVLQKQEKGDLAYLKDFKAYVNGTAELDNFSWYKHGWSYDMTVCGAKKFLDAIREKAGQYFQNSNYTEVLLDDELCPISLILMVQNESTIEYENMAERENAAFEAENRAAITYINMNARGKILNDFENMKALLSKTGDAAKDFVTEYDNRYINEFLELTVREEQKESEKRKNMVRSFAKKVERMDTLTLNFIRNMYQDLNIVFASAGEQQIDDDAFKAYLRQIADSEQPTTYPTEYFSFMKFILEGMNDWKEEEKEIFHKYCDKGTNIDRILLFTCFWEKYRNIDGDIYWTHLKKHLCTQSWIDWKMLKCLVRLIDAIADSKKTVLEFLNASDNEKLYQTLTEEKRAYQGMLSPVMLQEEILKARLIMYPNPGVTAEEKIARLEAFGERCNPGSRHNIRYLFYISGLWNGTIGLDSWDKICNYGGIAEQVFSGKESLDAWEKMYYLSVVDNMIVPPGQNCRTRWNNSILFWENTEIGLEQQGCLDRVKQCFDEIDKLQRALVPPKLPEEAMEDYVGDWRNKLGNDRRTWLYYLLHRSYGELLENCVQQTIGTKSGYGYGTYQDYAEYVLSRDLREKEFFVERNGWTLSGVEEGIFEKHVKKRDNDGFTNDKNMTVKLIMYYNIPANEKTYFKKRNEIEIYRYNFAGFDSNQEDCFNLEKDDTILKGFRTDFAACRQSISSILDNYQEEDYYQMVFKENCSRLREDLTKWMQAYPSLANVVPTCVKQGQREIVIKITKPIAFQTSSRQVAIAHDALLQQF